MGEKNYLIANNHSVDKVAFKKIIIEWGSLNFRSFPWRLTENPYHILMAEVMLHRTQASQVVAVYNRFIDLYPKVSSLVRARKDELHEILFSLGLHWRIDLIHEMAKELSERFNNQVPYEKSDLISLSGVNDYIASAVRCFAWNQPEPLIDTNTVRIAGRLFGLQIKDSSRRNPGFRNLITLLVDHREPKAYNYALLDLADQNCLKKRPPTCRCCPVLQLCYFGSSSGKQVKKEVFE